MSGTARLSQPRHPDGSNGRRAGVRDVRAAAYQLRLQKPVARHLRAGGEGDCKLAFGRALHEREEQHMHEYMHMCVHIHTRLYINTRNKPNRRSGTCKAFRLSKSGGGYFSTLRLRTPEPLSIFFTILSETICPACLSRVACWDRPPAPSPDPARVVSLWSSTISSEDSLHYPHILKTYFSWHSQCFSSNISSSGAK